MNPSKSQVASVLVICSALTVVSVLAVGYMWIASNSAKLEKAVALNEHGHTEAARLELISLIYGPASSLMLGNDERATALHMLGEVSLKDDKLSGTLAAWGALVDEYPDSQLAESVQEKIAEIEVDFSRSLADLESSVEASRYFRIADMWLEETEYEAPYIDTSYIPDEDAAVDWFNLTI